MACQVELWSLAIAKGYEERQVDKLVVAGGAGVGEGALVVVLALVDGNAAAMAPG